MVDFQYTEFYESKYKVCRAAFVAMGRIHRQNEKDLLKFLQRIQQMAYDGQKLGGPYASAEKDAQLERIRQTILEHIKERVS